MSGVTCGPAEEIFGAARAEFTKLGAPLESLAEHRLLRYLEMLLDWNTRVNLTRVVEPKEVVIKHYLDSATFFLAAPASQGQRVVDVGSGAGLPGLVVKVLRPDLRVTLLDASGKRVEFLRAVIGELGLEGIEALHLRAEEAGRARLHREAYDIATSRAVAAMPVLCEYLLPLVKVGGRVVALKGPEVGEELEAARTVAGQLGGEVRPTVEVDLPGGAGARRLVVVAKVEPTPEKYPRRAGMPEKRPLA